MYKKKVVVVISAKKKSNRLKNKNILPIKNLPMFLFVAKELAKSKKISKIIISSDSKFIKKKTLENNFEFIQRPNKLTYEKVEKQDVVVHAIKQFVKKHFKPDIVISVQPNSPQIKYYDIDKALDFFNKKLYPGSKKKELLSINTDKIQNAAFRIMTYQTVFQQTLSTKVGIYFCNYIDIHTSKEYLKAKRILEK